MEERIWKRPQLVPMPTVVNDMNDPVYCLNGSDWKLSLCPSESYYKKEDGDTAWESTTIPMQLSRNDKEYAYAYSLIIPQNWKQERIFLRFDGVNCYAKVYINGQFVKDHYGGFVSWDCEITEYIDREEENFLVIGVMDDPGGICPFHTGGIIRDISLFALPETYIARLHGDVKFDKEYQDAVLTVESRVNGENGILNLNLQDPDGNVIELENINAENGADISNTYKISNPLKWDSEHPYLYKMIARLIVNGEVVEETSRQIGFRQIEKRGNQIFINGDRLKLRGINRHDIHPVTGRAITHELVEQDVQLFKAANINFIRTSHYPPRPDFLDLCDKYGIYVEDETAVAFLGQEIDCRQNDPEFTEKFMDQFADLIERDRSHPCVILWSLANECFWGSNLALQNKYAHQEDPSRLTIFSYPITQHEDDERADIWSMHYAAWEQEATALVDSFDRSCHEPVVWPVLHDESTHIPCYDRTDHRRDQGVRDFWGETIKAFWDKLWNTDGALGCAIWAGLDEVWYQPSKGGVFGLQWGIIDGWRRKKPEYWHVRKAYSPVRLIEKPYEKDGQIGVAIENRFNHTNLKEVKTLWKCGGEIGSIMGPDLQPSQIGELRIPTAFASGEMLSLAFFDAFNNQVEEAEYVLGKEEAVLPMVNQGAPKLMVDDKEVVIEGDNFKICFSFDNGLIKVGYVNEKVVLTGGPYLHLTGLNLAPWEKDEFSYELQEDCALISVKGHYGKVEVLFEIKVDCTGQMETSYEILNMPYASPRKLAMRIGDDTDSGGYEEVGIRFKVPKSVDTLSWEKTGIWNVYPDWHIGRLKGQASKYSGIATKMGEVPKGEWAQEERNHVLFGKYDLGRRGTIDFASMKTGILSAKVSEGQDRPGYEVISDGTDSVRIRLNHAPESIVDDRDERLIYQGSWVQREVGYGSLNGTETWSNKPGDSCICKFTGTGIGWISSMDILGGSASVYVDGKLMDDEISMGVHLQTPGIARGYEKAPQRLVYAIEDLPMGEHTLEIKVNGKRTNGSMGAYVFIDHFIILGECDYGDCDLIINSEYNYPELSWGCYTKPPVRVYTGYRKKIYTRLE